MQDEIHLDWETKCKIDLKKAGLDRYSADPSCEVIMAAWQMNHGRVNRWTKDDGRFPAELKEALRDPEVKKIAFNAQFERVITNRVLKIKTPIKSWRCAMALAYMQSFSGDLATIGRAVGLPLDQQKLKEGTRLVRKFTMPQKVTRNQPFEWRDSFTDAADWELFSEYNGQDVVAEVGIWGRLIKYPIQDDEWELYALDQLINDRGLPIDLKFVENALAMSLRRKAELIAEMQDLTGLKNPNSAAQLTPWLRERGYPFNDINKDTVTKVLTEHEEAEREGRPPFLDEEAVAGLKLRQNAGRTSYTKYQTLLHSVGEDGFLRFTFQFAGAGRTSRWAGRRFQPHNLVRTPKELEHLLEEATEYIREGDYDGLNMLMHEPMTVLAGCMRSSIRAPEGEELTVADLSAIETCVTAWLSRCGRLLRVFKNKLDPYIDFGSDFFKKPYEEITKAERQISKPPVLGCTYRLGGGELRDGKRTGLWGYAESMKVNFTKEESHRAVKVFREGYPEIPKCWYALEDAVVKCVRTGRKIRPSFVVDGVRVEMPVMFELRKPYLMIWLPSGRALYYHQPRITKEVRLGKPTEQHPYGAPYEKLVFSYMGKPQNGQGWKRIYSHGGKIFENLVQAIARDVLKYGLLRAKKTGFDIRGHVHDEIITLTKIGENFLTVYRLIEDMSRDLPWAEGLPLAAAGYMKPFYRKD